MEEGVVSTDEDEDVGDTDEDVGDEDEDEDVVDEVEATDNGMQDEEDGEYTYTSTYRSDHLSSVLVMLFRDNYHFMILQVSTSSSSYLPFLHFIRICHLCFSLKGCSYGLHSNGKYNILTKVVREFWFSGYFIELTFESISTAILLIIH